MPAPRRAARPSAENPPPALRTDDHRRLPRRHARAAAGNAWLVGLKLPDLPVTWDDKLVRYLAFYRNDRRGRRLIRHWLRARGRQISMISRVLRKHGLPRDLSYVAMIESGYDPSKTSPVGAAGLWQFMVPSGRQYGLRRDHWVDERRNPERSTEAAARYLKELHGRFGSWELALAAYNAGGGMILNAMQKYNTNDYWRLCRYEAGLPWSTTLYVPKILAVAIVGNNRERFGFTDVEAEPPLASELVAVPGGTPLDRVARAAGVTLEQLERRNPELRRGRTPPGAKSWLRLPRGSSAAFYEKIATLRGARYRPYLVRLGDSDSSIAEAFGLSRYALRRLNGIRHASEVRAGVTILVPAGVRPRVTAAQPTPAAAGKASDEAADDEQARVLVALPAGAPEHVAGRRRVFYRVVVGDTLTEIARHLDVDAADLAAWNYLQPKALLVSTMVLQAFVRPTLDRGRVRLLDPQTVDLVVAGSAAFLETHEQRKGRRRLSYRVQKNDTLARVARRFGLTIGSLMRINKLGRNTDLQPDQQLVVYVETSPAKARGASKRRAPKRRGGRTRPRAAR